MHDRIGIKQSLFCALFLRFGLILYGEWHDSTQQVKFTDIDYRVFSDAANFTYHNLSPYKRATYRYTPLLAWLLTPGFYLEFYNFGKVLFCLCDIACGYLHYSVNVQTHSVHKQALWSTTFIWLFNPLTATVSVRGNAESVIALVVLLFLYSIVTGNVLLAGIFYGLSVHLKIYPVIFLPGIYLYLCHKLRHLHRHKQSIFDWLLPNSYHFQFAFTSIVGFVLPTLICYAYYGDEFIEHTFLYHLTRKDLRHNFSIYFYPMYLVFDSPYSDWLSKFAFLPQMISVCFLSTKFYTDLPFSCLVSTIAFVSFNKVCTSQYFLWYISLLPLCTGAIDITLPRSAFLLAVWFCGQGVWLVPAYYLEFQGVNNFLYLFMASFIFLSINVYVLSNLCSFHVSQKLKTA